MSDSCMYEFEDTVWGEFCQNDDHIVPHPCSEHAEILGNSHKKAQSEVTKITTSTGDRSATRHVDLKIEEKGPQIISKKRSTMLEKDSLSQTPSSVYPSASDGESVKEAPTSASDNDGSLCHGFKSNKTDSNGNEFCDTILNDKVSAIDNNSFSYPLGDIVNTGNNLDFLGNSDEKDSDEFLYYAWPEIGNFDDVDSMLRSCNSTFGFEASREDDVGLFSSVDDTGGSVDVVKSNSRFPSPVSKMAEDIAEIDESSKSYSIGAFAMTSGPIMYKDSSWTLQKSDPYLSFVNGPAFADKEDELIPKEQCVVVDGKIQPGIVTNRHTRSVVGEMVNGPRKQPNLRNQPVEKPDEFYFGNGSLDYASNLSSEVLEQSSGAISYQASPSMCMQQEEQASGLDYGYQQNPISHAQTDNCLLFNPPSVNPILSAVKSEGNGLPSLSPRDCSHGYSQLTALTGSAKREKIHNFQGSQTSKDSSTENTCMRIQHSTCDSGSEGKQANFFGNKFEDHNDVEGVNLVVPAELGSSNAQESSTMSGGLDDISLEAASFSQLQLVTKQLDMRTKLCIRDSLYRLARSAEQRHHHANLNGAHVGVGTNSFMDMEMDTNPIDRSIAHLLFHRPSESSAVPAQNSSLLNSSAVQLHGYSSEKNCL